MIGNLVNGDADMSFTGMAMNSLRNEVIDFVGPIFVEDYGFAIKTSKLEKLSWRTYIAPFNWKLWMSITIMIIGEALLIYLLQHLPNRVCI